MDGQEIMGRAVKVDFAKENPDRIQAREDAAAQVKEEDPNEIPEF
jgi:hypothetical protein